jgi:Na+-transporting NADH:ubiquinone oxidoreductase subunit A
MKTKTIRVIKGYRLNAAGAPGPGLDRLPDPERVALLPEHLPFVKPRLKVSEGDRVAVGSPLIEDKRNSDIRFLSPGGGRVVAINFGPRRVIREIVVRLDPQESRIEFDRYTAADIDKLERSELVRAIVRGGLWPLLRELPFRDYPHLDAEPPAIYVRLGSLEPFQPAPAVCLAGQEDAFRYGIQVLRKLAGDRVWVCAHRSIGALSQQLKGLVNLTYTGEYPAHDPGALLYRSKSGPEENRSWFIDSQDVLLLAELLQAGRYPTARTVVVAGSGAGQRRHVATRLGVPLRNLGNGSVGSPALRYIEGGILTGYKAPSGSYLGLYETALNLLPEANRPGELLGLFRPGRRKPTFSRAFSSALHRTELEMDCNIHGGERACIACSYCTYVCPVDILPQFAYKAVLAGEVEESLEHGLLDCVECGLCSYVCPSKIEIFETLKQAKADFYRQQAKK